MFLDFLERLQEGLTEDVNTRNLDWLKSQFFSDLKSATNYWGSDIELKSAEVIDNSSLEVKATVTFNLDKIDFDDLNGDDFDGYRVPDSIGEKIIESINEELIGELIFIRPDHTEVIYECELVDYDVDNSTSVETDYAPRTYDDPGYFDWEVDGYFEVDVELKLTPKSN